MTSLLTILPLAFVMVAGPQIISAIFIATSVNWRRNSGAFLAGALLAVTLFVTVAYFAAKLLKSEAGGADDGGGQTLDIVILLLLLFLAVRAFLTRKTTTPPKWIGRLQTATPKFSFRLGFLLLGVFPTDILTSATVGARLAP